MDKMAISLEELSFLAKKIGELYDEGSVINMSGVGTPCVLMKEAAFNACFPDHEKGEVNKSESGDRLFRVNKVEFDGVIFESVEYVEES